MSTIASTEPQGILVLMKFKADEGSAQAKPTAPAGRRWHWRPTDRSMRCCSNAPNASNQGWRPQVHLLCRRIASARCRLAAETPHPHASTAAAGGPTIDALNLMPPDSAIRLMGGLLPAPLIKEIACQEAPGRPRARIQAFLPPHGGAKCDKNAGGPSVEVL